MSFSTFLVYLRAFFPRIPDWHWIVIGVVSLALTIYSLSHKKCSTYGAVALGLAVFIGLYLLDALALNRVGMEGVREAGIDLEAEWHRLLHGGRENRMQMLFNVAAFTPLGFAMAEFWVSKGMDTWRCLGRMTLAAFGLSLCIECIQMFFSVGIFELTDLVLNTAGAVIGAGLSLVIHFLIQLSAKRKVYG